MKILITGGCGFVGSSIAIFLNKKKFKVFSLDNLSRKGSEINNLRLKKLGIKNYKIDIGKKNGLYKLPKFDFIIDCCAEVAVEKSKSDLDKVINTNLIGTCNLINKVIKDKSKIIFMSTSRVYSINEIKKKYKYNKNFKVNENFSTDSPISIYGFTKLASEKLIKEISYSNGIEFIINRFGVISGPWQFGAVDQGFISLWIWRHINKIPLTYKGYNGSGTQIRDIIHISDVCNLIILQIKKFKKIKNDTFNIGGGYKNKIDLKTLTKKCIKMTNNKVKISKIYKTSNYDVPYYISNNKKIFSKYNYKIKKNIDDILGDTLNWQKKNLILLKKYL